MNDPAATPVDVEEQRRWLIDRKQATGASWTELAKATGIASGTLSQFGSPNGYAGNNTKLAEQIFRYRQTLAAQSQIVADAPKRPGYFETPTSTQLTNMLRWAQHGRVVVAALGAGLGKTMTARHFASCYANVFVVTMTPSTSGVNNMQIEVLEALGERDAAGTPQKLSRRIRQRVQNLSNPLIVIDEAQHLSEKSVEEIRSWNDATGVGLALFGNESVLQRLEGGSRRAAYAQLFSRVGLRLVRSLPLAGDVDALADAWDIHADDARAYLRRIGVMPGGLRGAGMAIELAHMMASADRQPLAASHLQDAWAQLSSRPVAA